MGIDMVKSSILKHHSTPILHFYHMQIVEPLRSSLLLPLQCKPSVGRPDLEHQFFVFSLTAILDDNIAAFSAQFLNFLKKPYDLLISF